MRLSALAHKPALTVLVGAVAIAFSGILFRLSHVSPSTGAFFRCLWALPALWPVARWERRRWGRRPLRARAFAWLAGLFFTADLILWHNAIDQVAYGSNPPLGATFGVLTGLAYTGFLLVLRYGQRGVVGPAGPLFDATLSCTVGCLLAGWAIGDLDLTPSWAAQGWLVLLALSSQVLGWLLIAISLPRLPAVVTSVSLTLQPVCSVIFAALILGEAPSALQLVGAAGILAGLVIASAGRRSPPPPEPELAG